MHRPVTGVKIVVKHRGARKERRKIETRKIKKNKSKKRGGF